jgi:hypothetical protein
MKHVLVAAKKENHVHVKKQNALVVAKKEHAHAMKHALVDVKIMNKLADVVDVTNNKANHIN